MVTPTARSPTLGSSLPLRYQDQGDVGEEEAGQEDGLKEEESQKRKVKKGPHLRWIPSSPVWDETS